MSEHTIPKWLICEVQNEYGRATSKFGKFASAHEGYAILQEEIDELWDEIKGGQNTTDMRDECIQIAAMALRFIMDVA